MFKILDATVGYRSFVHFKTNTASTSKTSDTQVIPDILKSIKRYKKFILV